MNRTPLNRRKGLNPGSSKLSRGSGLRPGEKQLSRHSKLKARGRRSKAQATELALFRRTVLERAGHACESCGATEGLHAHHMRNGARARGEHNPSEGACLCGRCHTLAHAHQLKDWRRWFIQEGPNSGASTSAG